MVDDLCPCCSRTITGLCIVSGHLNRPAYAPYTTATTRSCVDHGAMAMKQWDRFFKLHQANFFKDRHWLLGEMKLEGEPWWSAGDGSGSPLEDMLCHVSSYRATILECGCGAGNTLFPLLREMLGLSDSPETDETPAATASRCGGDSPETDETPAATASRCGGAATASRCGGGPRASPPLSSKRPRRRNSSAGSSGDAFLEGRRPTLVCVKPAMPGRYHWRCFDISRHAVAVCVQRLYALVAASPLLAFQDSASHSDCSNRLLRSTLATLEHGAVTRTVGVSQPPVFDANHLPVPSAGAAKEIIAVHTFVFHTADLCASIAVPDCPPVQFQLASLIFVLSAVPPPHHARALGSIAAWMRPGGLLFFRDYAVGDVTASRLKVATTPITSEIHSNLLLLDSEYCLKEESASSTLSSGGSAAAAAVHHHPTSSLVRGDGTLSYLFSERYLRSLTSSVGLSVESVEVTSRTHTNRAMEETLTRFFITARLRRAADSAEIH